MAAKDVMEQYPALGYLAFYGTVCVLKLFLMALLTGKNRLARGIFSNEEDMKLSDSKAKIHFTDPVVERIRRNHLNDLENIPAFVLIGVFYVLTQPSPQMALLHFRVFTVARFLHMMCYQFSVPQPSRALCFFVGLIVTTSMAVQVLMAMPY